MPRKRSKEKQNNTKLDDFLEELTELSKKYKLVIGGCGCCGSPNIFDDDSSNGKYTIEVKLDSDGRFIYGDFLKYE